MPYIPRFIYFSLEEHLTQPEISLVLGPRQAGKTVLLRRLQTQLVQAHQPTVFLNLDIIEDRQFFTSQHTLLNYIKRQTGRQKTYVFIDEISRLANPGRFLKGLFDLQSRHKYIVSGSGALELKDDLLEPLTGRKKTFHCFPLSFSEFIVHHQPNRPADLSAAAYQQLRAAAANRLTTQPYIRQRLIQEYLSFGGYPRVVLAQTTTQKIDILREIFTSYLEKDITLILQVEKGQAFENLVKILASQTGNLINRAELSSTLGISEKTIKKYLYLLEKTYVIHLVKPFFQNPRREVTKSPKVYFVDLGFLHLARGVIPSLTTPISGAVFENACLIRLKELNLLKPPQYWRTKSGAELDFIVSSPTTGQPIPIESKLTPPHSLGKSFISFLKKYRPDTAYLYSLADHGHSFSYPIDSQTDSTIHLLPFHRLPLQPPTILSPKS